MYMYGGLNSPRVYVLTASAAANKNARTTDILIFMRALTALSRGTAFVALLCRRLRRACDRVLTAVKYLRPACF